MHECMGFRDISALLRENFVNISLARFRYCSHTTIPRGVLAWICQNPETYKPKFHCRRQSGMNFGYVTVNEVNSNTKVWLDSKKYIEYIANKKCIWYNASRQNDKVKFIYNTAKAPELRPLRLFYSVWAGWLIPPGWLPAAIFYPTICKCSRRLHLPEWKA